MGLAKISITGVKLPAGLVLGSLVKNLFDSSKEQDKFKVHLASLFNKKYSLLFNSGISCCYVILEGLKKITSKREVVLPAYTAGSLVVAIKKAGLKPVLCDVSLSDFNMDENLLTRAISSDTLCVLVVHSFGIINRIPEKRGLLAEELFFIEDCAQSLGSRWREKPSGSFGDVSFFSFNRGKNLSSFGGGCIVTDSKYLMELMEKEWGRCKGISLKEKIALTEKMLAMSFALNPFVYGLFFNLISRFKETKPPQDIEVKKYSDFQADIADASFKMLDEITGKRYDNGMRLINALKGREDIILPAICEDIRPAFNRLPVVFKDVKIRERVEKKLWEAGIETSRMYLKPLHHMFELGYKRTDFPNAVYLAERLLALPVHPLMSTKELDKIVDIIKRNLG